jgi:23S rRNA pseudouridine2605 synthase
MAQERLQKILAAAGVASRRKAEELITAGRISVNGETVTELGSKADARTDEIRVDGQLLRGRERHVYIALYKPKGYVTTVSDPEGRPTVMDLLRDVEQRVFPVGRLDYASEGLLLLTNDGGLMQQLTSAASHVPKTYMVKVSGVPDEEQIDRLRAGIHLPSERSRAGTMGGTRPGTARHSGAVRTQPAKIELLREQDNPWYRVTLTEGRNRQIRRMFEQIGHHVEKIRRIRYGSLELDLEPGKWRFLKTREIAELRNPRPARPAAAQATPEAAQTRRISLPQPARQQRRPSPGRPFASREGAASPRRDAAPPERGPGKRPESRRSFRDRPFGKTRGRSERPSQGTQNRRQSGTAERPPQQTQNRRPSGTPERPPQQTQNRRPSGTSERRPSRPSGGRGGGDRRR